MTLDISKMRKPSLQVSTTPAATPVGNIAGAVGTGV